MNKLVLKKDIPDLDKIPDWTETDSGWQCSDSSQMALAFVCNIHSFNLPGFDTWVKALPDCPLKTDCIQRRQRAVELLQEDDEEKAHLALEVMHMAQRLESREGFLLPHAKQITNNRQSGGKKTGEIKTERAADNQAEAVRLWHSLEMPERSRAAIIAKRMGFDPSTVRGWLRKAGLR